MRKLCFLSVLFAFSCFATNNTCVSSESSPLKKYDQLVSKMSDVSLVDVRPEVGVAGTSEKCCLKACYFGLSDYVKFIGDEGAIRSNDTNLLGFIFSNNLYCVRCVDNDATIFSLDVFDNDECKVFFSQRDGGDLIKALKWQSNCTYKSVVTTQKLLQIRDNQLKFIGTSISSLESFFSEIGVLNAFQRLYAFNKDSVICGTIGIAPHTIAKSETSINKMYVPSFDFIPVNTVAIDYYVLPEYRRNGIASSILEETLKIVFGNKCGDTRVNAVLLNIDPSVIASLKIAYKHGFQTLKELFPESSAAARDGINYLLKRDFYFEHKDEILAGNYRISKGIEERINRAEEKISNDAEKMLNAGVRKSLKRTRRAASNGNKPSANASQKSKRNATRR